MDSGYRGIAQMLTCRVEHRFPVAVVRLAGQLDRRTVAEARTGLCGCLADQPTAVVVDVSRLSADRDSAAELFPSVARFAARWPGAVLLVCAPGPELGEALRQLRITISSRHQALTLARARPLPPCRRVAYEPSRQAPARARAVVAGACAEWGVGTAAPAAQVVVSELVANAVVHAGTPLELTVALRGGLLQVAVRDRDRRRLRPGMPEATAEGGRGLMVVEALATDWGTVPAVDGKVVWASIDV